MKDPTATLHSAFMFHQQGKLARAVELYKTVLRSQPANFDALFLLATASAQQNRFEDALGLFERAHKLKPRHPETLNNLGNVLLELKRYDDALASYDKSLTVRPGDVETYTNRGVALQKLNRFEEAVTSFDRALSLRINHAEAWNNRGVSLEELMRYEEALASFDKALGLKPDYAEAWNNRGNALAGLERYDEAFASFDKSSALVSSYADAYLNKGKALLKLKRYDEAAESYRKALSSEPDNPEYHLALASLYILQKRFAEALPHTEKAIVSNPELASAHEKQGSVLFGLARFKEAAASYNKALCLDPGISYLLGQYFQTCLKSCDWSNYGTISRLIEDGIKSGRKVCTPFFVLSIIDSQELQHQAAKIISEEKYPFNPSISVISKHKRHEKIRVGYFSADYRFHATSFLAAGLFGHHDRSRFEITGFSLSPGKEDEMRKRIVASFDRYIDVNDLSDREVAELSREQGIDIAVDLGGYTTHCRTGIFAMRAAPLQVNYLGYAGSMAAEYMDYIIADPVVIPERNRRYFTEKIAYLPCYQVNDDSRPISEKRFTRCESGLPEDGFVFCSFNNSFKLHPSVFESWMRILNEVDGSVLWLLEDNPEMKDNLRNAAISNGIDPERLVFAPRIRSNPEHLARHRMADLFLDSLPYNAHTTASDALWTGLPLVTLAGESFPSRVAASLLSAIGLPELITSTMQEYEHLAIELARKPEKMRRVRENLERNRRSTILFDTARFTRNIEKAFETMYERYLADLPPDHIFVNP